MESFVKVLKLVDNEKKPVMEYIYEAMDRPKEAIQKTFDRDESKYKDVFAISDKRWRISFTNPFMLPATC